MSPLNTWLVRLGLVRVLQTLTMSGKDRYWIFSFQHEFTCCHFDNQQQNHVVIQVKNRAPIDVCNSQFYWQYDGSRLGICISSFSHAYAVNVMGVIVEEAWDMMTSSNGNIFRVTGPLCGEFTGPGEFPTQRPVTRSFDVFLDLRLNKRLSKQWWGWWFETPSWSLWRHRNEMSIIVLEIYDHYLGLYITRVRS